MLTIKYISKSKETLKLLLNIQIILSSNKIQMLQKQQFINYFATSLRKIIEFGFLYFTSSLKKLWEMCTPLQSIKLLIILRATDKKSICLSIYLASFLFNSFSFFPCHSFYTSSLLFFVVYIVIFRTLPLSLLSLFLSLKTLVQLLLL